MILSESQIVTRVSDLAYFAQRIAHNDCCAVVGVSNIGKSNLLRQIRRPGVISQLLGDNSDAQFGFVYIDFNLQLQLTGQGFYELVLRSVLTQLKHLSADEAIIAQVQDAYNQIVAPTDEFQNALSFNQAIITLCEQWSHQLVLLFDEFDEVFKELESRVFLNLRALRDKYPEQLTYVVSTGVPLLALRRSPDIGEFAELFTHHTHKLRTLEHEDLVRMVEHFATENNVQFASDDLQFIAKQSGGHPGLLETVCQILINNTVAGVARDSRMVLTHLADSPNIREECAKLWQGLSIEKQTALQEFVHGNTIPEAMKTVLLNDGILIQSSEKQPQIFGRLFEEFVRRQRLVQATSERGIRIDVDAGQVYVDGTPVEVLTKLEYRLLLLMYGNLEKICDKYSIVEAVWGEDYIEEVDDARIEKLISRLRQKIEPKPSNPQYLITVRGRGYRLQNA